MRGGVCLCVRLGNQLVVVSLSSALITSSFCSNKKMIHLEARYTKPSRPPGERKGALHVKAYSSIPSRFLPHLSIIHFDRKNVILFVPQVRLTFE